MSAPRQIPPSARLPAGEAAGRRPLLVLGPYRRFSPGEVLEVWGHRELLAILAWRDVSVRYKQALLGVVWALLQPALQALIFTVLFHKVAGLAPGHGVPFVPFVLAGLAVWNVFSGGLAQASDSLVRNAQLVTKVYFPRVILPASSLLVPLVDFVWAMLLLAGVMAYHGLPLRPRAVLTAPLALLALLLSAGPGLALSALNVAYRDVRYALPFLTQLLLYVAPVFFPASAVPERLRPLLDANPMAPVIEGFRAALFGGEVPWAGLGWSLAAALASLALGYVYFRHVERTFADQM